jgi:tetratricopeptide (TPR) repeat protein
MISVNTINMLIWAAAPAPAPGAAPDPCAKLKTLPADLRQCREDQHDLLLERNWDKRETTRKKALSDTIARIDRSLDLVDDKNDGLLEGVKGFVFNEARRANFQVDNWLMLDAARKSVDMFYRSRGDLSYLRRAATYLQLGLDNADTNASFDIYTFSLKDLFSPTIHPVEAYFEMEMTRFQVLSILKPAAALKYGHDIEAELKSLRVTKAQRATRVSAQGYLNRLRIFYGFAGLYNPAMAKDVSLKKAALQAVRDAHVWAAANHEEGLVYLKKWGMNKKDLRYDTLTSKVIEGRLLIKTGQYAEALKLFQALLREPEASKKYGGFLDIGLQAFYNILHISLATSPTLSEAARKFDTAIDWKQIASGDFVDFRESIGLVIRDQKRTDVAREKIGEWAKTEVPKYSDILGEYSLLLGWPRLAPKEDSPIHQPNGEISLADYKTPEDKLALFMRLLKYVEFPFDQKAEVDQLYNTLQGVAVPFILRRAP